MCLKYLIEMSGKAKVTFRKCCSYIRSPIVPVMYLYYHYALILNFLKVKFILLKANNKCCKIHIVQLKVQYV